MNNEKLFSSSNRNKGKKIPNLFLWPLSLIPAICVVFFYFHEYTDNGFRFYFEIFAPLIVTFVINLLLPIAINKRKAFLFAIPTSIVAFYFFSFPVFWEYFIYKIYPNETDAPLPNEYLLFGAVITTLVILHFVATSFCAWVGARLRKPINSNSQTSVEK
jgi:hypothetical protein